MTSKAIKSGMTTSFIVAFALSIAALASVQGDGVSVSTGGIDMTLKASFEKGLEVNFIAPE